MDTLYHFDGLNWSEYYKGSSFANCCGARWFASDMENDFHLGNKGLQLMITEKPLESGEKVTADSVIKIFPTEAGFLNFKFNTSGTTRGEFPWIPHVKDFGGEVIENGNWIAGQRKIINANWITTCKSPTVISVYLNGISAINKRSDQWLREYYGWTPEIIRAKREQLKFVSSLPKGSIIVAVTATEQAASPPNIPFEEYYGSGLKTVYESPEAFWNGNYLKSWGYKPRMFLHLYEKV